MSQYEPAGEEKARQGGREGGAEGGAGHVTCHPAPRGVNQRHNSKQNKIIKKTSSASDTSAIVFRSLLLLLLLLLPPSAEDNSGIPVTALDVASKVSSCADAEKRKQRRSRAEVERK